MLELIISIGSDLFSNIVQIAVGCILSVLILFFGGKVTLTAKGSLHKIITLITFPVLGMALPLGIYGIIPIVAACIQIGFKYHAVCSMLISNAIFNMSVPFQDASFVWKTGVWRMIFAFVLAVLAGLLLTLLKCKEEKWIKVSHLLDGIKKPYRFESIIKSFGGVINKMGLFLIAGIIFDTIYHKYIWWEFIKLLFSNPYTAGIPFYLSGLNVVNPFFLVAITLVFILMDFVRLSVMVAVMKPKGILGYYLYFGAAAALLSLTAFL